MANEVSKGRESQHDVSRSLPLLPEQDTGNLIRESHSEQLVANASHALEQSRMIGLTWKFGKQTKASTLL
jgi:hypothetical protein